MTSVPTEECLLNSSLVQEVYMPSKFGESSSTPEVVILPYKLCNTILHLYRNFKFLSISFHWNAFSFSKNMIKVHTNHQTRKYSSKCTRLWSLRFFSKTIIRKFLIPHYILIFFYIFAKKVYLWLFRKNDCLNSLNPSLVTLITTKEKLRAMGVNNPCLNIMITKSYKLVPVYIFLTGQYNDCFESKICNVKCVNC